MDTITKQTNKKKKHIFLLHAVHLRRGVKVNCQALAKIQSSLQKCSQCHQYNIYMVSEPNMSKFVVTLDEKNNLDVFFMCTIRTICVV